MSTPSATATGKPSPQSRTEGRAAAARPALARRLLPFLRWFDGYSGARLRADALAGLTVALVLIPQSMAYAQLAGLPAYYGLYAAFLPPMLAAMFGSSHQLATGPVAIVSLMTAAALEPLATAGGTSFIAYAVALSVLVGAFQLALGVLRLGAVVNFLSHPVVNGFTNAGALIIATSQLSPLLGVTVDRAEHHYETVYFTVKAALGFVHWPTLGLAALAIAIMVGLRRLSPKIPGVLIAVVVTTVIAWATGFENNRKVPLTALRDEQAVTLVGELNSAIEAVDMTAAAKLKAATELEQVGSGAGADPAAATRLRNAIALHDLELSQHREHAHRVRERLRAMLFDAAEGPNGIELYARGKRPAELPAVNGTWRLKVGNRKLSADALSAVGGGAVIGEVPKGLRFGLPTRDAEGGKIDLLALIPKLLGAAIVISLLGFMEAISIAKSMAAKTGQRLDANQELIGQGIANLAGSFAQAYPVSGSFSRSAVNLSAGAVTGLSSVFASVVVLATLYFLTPLLYHLPQSVLAAIIIMAVVGLLNVRGFIHAWHAQRYDGAISVLTFAATLGFAPHLDKGIMIGVALSLGLYLVRNMKPEVALLAKHPDGTYRNAARFELERCRHIAVIRFNQSLFFANVAYLEDRVLEVIATMRELKHVILVGNAINELDASGEEMLSLVVTRLREGGYDVSLTGLNDSVLDVLRRTRLYERIGEDHMFRSVAHALDAIHAEAHRGSDERQCPLLFAPFRPLAVDVAVAEKLKRRDGGQRERPADATRARAVAKDAPEKSTS